jgi:hypothetical protein
MSDTMTHDEVTTARWKAIIYYRSENGLIDVEHGVEEIEDLQDIVERGPDWNAIERIEITLDRVALANLTIEEAAGL